MNNQVEFVCLWCCAPLDFVVEINNFFSLVLFSAVTHKGKGKKLISKIINIKQPVLQRYNLLFFTLKTFKDFLEDYRFCRNSENDANSSGLGALCICSLRHYDVMRTEVDM